MVSYADDLVFAVNSEEEAKAIIEKVEKFAVDFGLTLNSKKCEYALSGRQAHTGPAVLTVQQEQLLPRPTLDILGVTLQAEQTPFQVEAARSQQRDKEVERKLTTLRGIRMSWQAKGRAAMASPMSMLAYGSWTKVKSRAAEIRAKRHKVARAVHGRAAFGPRSVEVLLAGFLPVHRADPKWVPRWRTLAHWHRWLKREVEDLREVTLHNINICGPAAAVAHIVRATGGEIRGDRGKEILWWHGHQIDLRADWTKEVQHQWREAIRKEEWHQTRQRRTDFSGDLDLLDRKALQRQQRQFATKQAADLKVIQAGGVITGDRMERHSQKGTGVCPCTGARADMEHIVWFCQGTEEERRQWRGAVPESVEERKNAIPLTSRTAEEQDRLARVAVDCLQKWRRTYQQATREDAGLTVEERPEETPDQPAEDRKEERRRHRDRRWSAYAFEGLEVSEDRAIIRCSHCLAEGKAEESKPFFERHSRCAAPPRSSHFGPAPARLPAGIFYIEGTTTRGPRVGCSGCSCWEHYCHRASFVGAHLQSCFQAEGVALSSAWH